jgi:hypothetical protein
VQNPSGQTWAVGTITNDHVLTDAAGWVPLNAQANRSGPWRPGDVVNDHAFTGLGWVPLPAGWRPDPMGRHQLRWWTGHTWSSQVLTNGPRFDESMTPALPPVAFRPPVPPQPPVRVRDILAMVALVTYCGSWFIVAVYSAAIAARESEPRLLLLTSTASLNALTFMLTGRTKGEIRRDFIEALKPKLGYLFCGAIAAVGVWLSLHFDDTDILITTGFVVAVGLTLSWGFS